MLSVKAVVASAFNLTSFLGLVEVLNILWKTPCSSDWGSSIYTLFTSLLISSVDVVISGFMSSFYTQNLEQTGSGKNIYYVLK